MTAKEYLNQFKLQHDKVEQIREAIEELKQASYTPTFNCGSNRTTGHTSDKVGRAVIKSIDLQEKLNAATIKYIETWQDITTSIDDLANPAHRIILNARYIQLKAWPEVARSLDYSTQHCYKLHGEALTAFEQKFFCGRDLEIAGPR